MDLFLIRHAKSSWTDDSLRDIDRPLNNRGKRQVEAMARPLLAIGALEGTIHVSHACRARQTVEGLLEQMPSRHLVSRVYFDPELYTFRHKDLLKWIRQQDSPQSCLTLVGHNPALTDLAQTLTGAEVPDMVTGAVLHLEVPVSRWSKLGKGQARLVQYLPPAQASYRLFRRKAPKAPEARGDLRQQVPVSLQHQVETILALEPGVRQGTDPEFLHQFRVNLRRSRAVTEAIVTITGHDTLREAVKPLKRMARRTSVLRDLDVFLLYLEDRTADDPRLRRSLRASGALDSFHHWREQAHQALCRHLDDKQWHRGLHHWQDTITGKGLDKALKQTTPDAIHDTVQDRADACLERFRQLTAAAPDEDFHEVRKALKRLRYLAELDKPRYRALLGELKDLQGLYGEFQDRHQQQVLLEALADTRLDRCLPPVLAELAQRIDREKAAAREAILANSPRIAPVPGPSDQ